MQPDQAIVEPKPAPGRECGTCSLCCKVYEMPDLDKPIGAWCRHCIPGRGCAIHATRPEQCRIFYCLWMTEGWLGQEWKPERSKIVLRMDSVNNMLLAQVEPGNAQAWRKEPFYSQLKAWSRSALGTERYVVVFVNHLGTVVLPESDVPIGRLNPGDRLVRTERQTPKRPVLHVEKVSAA